MGIEELSRSILAQAKHTAERTTHQAEKEASELIHSEKARRTLLLKSVGEEANRKLEEVRGERLAWARLERKRLLAEAQERAIVNTFDQIIEYLETFRKSKEYKDFLKSALDQATAELGPKAVVHVAKGEKALLGKATLKVVEDLEGLGGLVAESPNRDVRLNLTLESLLEAKKEALRKRIAGELF